MEKNDVVFVVGNLPELGAWNHNQAIPLTKEHSGGTESPLVFDSNTPADFTDYYGNSGDGLDSAGDHASNNSNE